MAENCPAPLGRAGKRPEPTGEHRHQSRGEKRSPGSHSGFARQLADLLPDLRGQACELFPFRTSNATPDAESPAVEAGWLFSAQNASAAVRMALDIAHGATSARNASVTRKMAMHALYHQLPAQQKHATPYCVILS